MGGHRTPRVIVPRPTLMCPTFLFEKLVLIRMSAVIQPNAPQGQMRASQRIAGFAFNWKSFHTECFKLLNEILIYILLPSSYQTRLILFQPQALFVRPARSFARPLRRALCPFCIILELIHLHKRRIFDTELLAWLQKWSRNTHIARTWRFALENDKCRAIICTS